jgi:DNA-binding transcriptional regulator YiaG
MFTDRDFYRSVLAGALEAFELEKLAVLLNAPVPEVARWAQGRARPPAPVILRLIDLMSPPN